MRERLVDGDSGTGGGRPAAPHPLPQDKAAHRGEGPGESGVLPPTCQWARDRDPFAIEIKRSEFYLRSWERQRISGPHCIMVAGVGES